MTLNHGSITWLTVHPTGEVTLRRLGDTGFMPVSFYFVTLRRLGDTGFMPVSF